MVRDDVYPGTRLSFFRVGSKGNSLTLELVAPLEKKPGKEEAPARIWGVTWVAGGGLETVAAALGDGFHLSAGKPAIQPGRRIATLRGEAGGLAMAFMTPKGNAQWQIFDNGQIFQSSNQTNIYFTGRPFLLRL